jgi:hypothetical protein
VSGMKFQCKFCDGVQNKEKYIKYNGCKLGQYRHVLTTGGAIVKDFRGSRNICRRVNQDKYHGIGCYSWW